MDGRGIPACKYKQPEGTEHPSEYVRYGRQVRCLKLEGKKLPICCMCAFHRGSWCHGWSRGLKSHRKCRAEIAVRKTPSRENHPGEDRA